MASYDVASDVWQALISGTQDYFSPELVGKKGVTRAGDIWTFGVFMFEISAGYPPFTAGPCPQCSSPLAL
jgi:serine/threonine protein kinase